MLIETLVSALAPVAIEGVKQAAAKWLGTRPKAMTVDEQLKLDNAEIERMKVVAELDKPIGNPSQWVVDLRSSARYVGALGVIAVGIGSLFVVVAPAVQAVALEASSIAFGFLFGSRIVSSFKR